jgi:alcohol dehydrogenase, propanol-preferring
VGWIRDVCGGCAVCLHGRSGGGGGGSGETYCPHQSNSATKVHGTFAEYVVVPARYAVRLPPSADALADEAVAPILCGGVTAYKALKNAGCGAGAWVVVSGAGGAVGGFAVQYARAMGFRVVGVDVGAEKGARCRELGVEAFVDAAAAQDVVAEVKKVTGGGAAAVLVTTPAKQAYQSALAMVGTLGTMVCVGIPGAEGTFTVHPVDFIARGVRVVGSAVGTRGDILEALDFVARKVVVPTVELATLDDLTGIAAKFADGTVSFFSGEGVCSDYFVWLTVCSRLLLNMLFDFRA